ncbi:hypothetical protein JAAARDRAFT_128119 [Jaapia argillacea MUCL 33604]|uniref:C2H2-type domain-containing protein n=1 Tax=Jaapia argillacea MUCL 33604 TaxID=933084 RepID=A0A067Q6K2_9AGAM|nr:hypothetical protein JAAARDRAFT_128119 [Jaapia argillacea MUCL 33604]
MKTILEYASRDALVRATLSSTFVPKAHGASVFDVLNGSVASGAVAKGVAKPLSDLLVVLARSEALFSSLRNSDAPAQHLDKGKRKREEVGGHDDVDERIPKRPMFTHHYDQFQSQVQDAVRIITNALTTNPNPQDRPLEPSLIASIQLQLHQVFLFAVTSSAGGSGHEVNVLQEISGLIQVLGVLSGIQIGQAGTGGPSNITSPAQTYAVLASSQPQTTDIGTAVYPCLVPSCGKTFSPWKCAGCDKVFSRRDAIKRHKNTASTKGPDHAACVDSEVEEVEVSGDDEGRRARMWGGPRGDGHPGAHGFGDGGLLGEEGEISPDVIKQLRAAVISLHPYLQAHVTSALGMPAASGPSTIAATTDNGNDFTGQATLASVIAKAQTQALPTQANSSTTEDMLLSQSGHRSEEAPANQSPQDADSQGSSSLTLYGLSDEQTKLLEEAIASAAAAAQAQAEAEALAEEEEDYDDEDEDAEGEEIDKGG